MGVHEPGENKIIFDGYPRNINQAKALEVMLNSDNQSINFILLGAMPGK